MFERREGLYVNLSERNAVKNETPPTHININKKPNTPPLRYSLVQWVCITAGLVGRKTSLCLFFAVLNKGWFPILAIHYSTSADTAPGPQGLKSCRLESRLNHSQCCGLSACKTMQLWQNEGRSWAEKEREWLRLWKGTRREWSRKRKSGEAEYWSVVCERDRENEGRVGAGAVLCRWRLSPMGLPPFLTSAYDAPVTITQTNEWIPTRWRHRLWRTARDFTAGRIICAFTQWHTRNQMVGAQTFPGH